MLEPPSKGQMSLHPAKLQKPLCKLRKMLNKIPRKPAPEQVHDLRTLIRRIEAMFRAPMIESKRNQKKASQGAEASAQKGWQGAGYGCDGLRIEAAPGWR